MLGQHTHAATTPSQLRAHKNAGLLWRPLSGEELVVPQPSAGTYQLPGHTWRWCFHPQARCTCLLAPSSRWKGTQLAMERGERVCEGGKQDTANVTMPISTTSTVSNQPRKAHKTCTKLQTPQVELETTHTHAHTHTTPTHVCPHTCTDTHPQSAARCGAGGPQRSWRLRRYPPGSTTHPAPLRHHKTPDWTPSTRPGRSHTHTGPWRRRCG